MRRALLISLLLALCLGAATACGAGAPTTSAAGGSTTRSSAGQSATGEVPSTAPTSTTETTLPPAITVTPAAEEAVAAMSIRAKAAQVLLVAFDGTTLTSLTTESFSGAFPGGVLLLGRNVTGREQLSALTGALQKAAKTQGAPALFVAADEEGGAVMRVKEGVPSLPAARVVGETYSVAHAESLAEATADGLLAQGVNMVLAPVADVVDDESSFLYDRTFGGDPALVVDFVSAVTLGYGKKGLIAVVKHFPGHGSAPGDSHDVSPVSAAMRVDFERTHLPPFKAAFAAGAEGVMMGHFVVPAYDRLHPASQSKAIVEELLRRDLGFTGLAVSDDLEMVAATGNAGGVGGATVAELGRASVASLAAGCDLLITSGTRLRQLAIVEAIVQAVQAGTLSEQRLDEAVARILSLKVAHGL